MKHPRSWIKNHGPPINYPLFFHRCQSSSILSKILSVERKRSSYCVWPMYVHMARGLKAPSRHVYVFWPGPSTAWHSCQRAQVWAATAARWAAWHDTKLAGWSSSSSLIAHHIHRFPLLSSILSLSPIVGSGNRWQVKSTRSVCRALWSDMAEHTMTRGIILVRAETPYVQSGGQSNVLLEPRCPWMLGGGTSFRVENS